MSWLGRLMLGAAVGALVGVIELGVYEFSWLAVLTSTLVGAAFFAAVGVLAPLVSESRVGSAILGGVAGAVAGVVWAVVRGTDTFVAALCGALVGSVYGLFEFGGNRRCRRDAV